MKSLDFDKKLEYQEHQRDYSLLATSVVFRGLFNENKAFFGAIPHPAYVAVKDGVLYHFMAKADAIDRCEKFLQKNSHSDLLKIEEKYDQKLKEFNLFIKNRRGDPEDSVEELHRYFVDFTNIVLVGYDIPDLFGNKISKDLYDLCIKIRIKYEDVHKKCFSEEDKIAEELERKYNFAEKTISYLTIFEFNDFIKTKKLPEDFNLEQRKRFFILKYTEDGEDMFTDENLWKEFQPDVGDKEIRGNVAFPGKIKGCVKIIRAIEDAAALNEGDVLIASMTDPRYVFAMKKAGAIVTNEGGITCHAAIVARELKKPCIIGTKIATKVLRDGDLVEVDANSGIVKIIK